MSQAAASDTRALRLERLIAAPPDRVFGFWTEPDLLVQWWGPDGYDVPVRALDLRPGGRWRTTMRSPEGNQLHVSGRYRMIDKPRRLVFTWAWDQENGSPGHETEVTVTFDAAPGGTRLELAQQTFQSREIRDSHGKGWSSSFDCLARVAK